AAYGVRIDDQGQSATAGGVFTVTAGGPGHLGVRLSSPSVIRPGQQGTAIVDYFNDGDTDVPAPLLIVAADNAMLRLPDQSSFAGNSVQALGINAGGPAGVLPPGYHGT